MQVGTGNSLEGFSRTWWGCPSVSTLGHSRGWHSPPLIHLETLQEGTLGEAVGRGQLGRQRVSLMVTLMSQNWRWQ